MTGSMARSLAPLFAAGLLASALSGCTHHRHGADPIVFVSGAVVGAAIASADVSDAHRGHRDRDVPTIVYVSVPPAPPREPPRDRVRTPQAPTAAFDGVAARAAFAQVDLSHCKSAGAPSAHGHAKVSFNPSGEASKVVVDEPADLAPAAAKCIGDALGAVTVPPFAGSYITVGTSYYVR